MTVTRSSDNFGNYMHKIYIIDCYHLILQNINMINVKNLLICGYL